ncbi:MAG: nuclear transport factor 2 family protein [Solirubrobacteraceae bacterium]
MTSQSRRVVEEFWAPFESGSPTGEAAERWKGLFAEDGVWEMPFAPAPVPEVVAGRVLIGHFADWLFAAVPDLRLVSFDARETADPQVILIEMQMTSPVTYTGRTYANTYCSLMRIVDGRVALFREYFDPTVVLDAFGVEVLEAGIGQVMAAAA